MMKISEPITVEGIRKYIRYCLRYGKFYDFLVLVENKELTPEVESLFAYCHNGYVGYDWINGNENMLKIIVEEENKKGISSYEKLCRRMGFVPDKEHLTK